MNDLIRACLIHDGGDQVELPGELGIPRADQLQGTSAERLIEIAGRICYDSLGKGRPSFSDQVVTGADPHTGEQIIKDVEGFHEHIQKVGHLSVVEHAFFTAEFTQSINEDRASPLHLAYNFLNRPNLFVVAPCAESLRVTFNLRHVLEWAKQGVPRGCGDARSPKIGAILRHLVSSKAPHIVGPPGDLPESFGSRADAMWQFRLVEPQYDQEKHISLYLAGSRGFSHEMVRHRFQMSQRSTRYVDESESEWVNHPLTDSYFAERPYGSLQSDNPELLNPLSSTYLAGEMAGVMGYARFLYSLVVSQLEPWLISRGVDKLTARKQARGAARGYLGNALYTEMIFTASVAQWKHMLKMRASAAADAEIREVFTKALPELQRSRYGESFAGWRLEPSPDGIGQVAIAP